MKRGTLQNLEIMRIKATKNIQKDGEHVPVQSVPTNRMVFTQVNSSPAVCLPRIGPSHRQTSSLCHSSDGVSQLESYISHLLLKHQLESGTSKKRKKWEEELQERRQKQSQQQQKMKQEREGRYMRRLKVKLANLQMEMEVEEKKLELDYRFEGKMVDCYNQLFERLKPVQPEEKNIGNTQVETPAIEVPLHTEAPVAEAVKEKPSWKRKFRIAGYVVYFSVLFPKYVRKFNQIRRIKYQQTLLKPHALRKELDNGLKIYETIMKINTFWKELQRENRKEKGNFAYFDFEETDDGGNLIEFSFRLSNVSHFLLKILGHLKRSIADGNLDGLINLLSYVLTSNSFLADRLFFLHEIYRLQLNLTSKSLVLSKQQEVGLLINFFIIKFTINGYMVKFGESSQLKSGKLTSGLKAKKTNDTMMIQKQLLISSVYLLNLTNQLTYHQESDELLRKNGNIEKLQDDSCPLLMKNIELSKDIIMGQENESQSEIKKRSSIQNAINIEQVNQKGIMIDKMSNFKDIVEQIENNDTKRDEITALIHQVGELLHQKCRKYHSDHYKTLHVEMLNKKKIITEPFQQQSQLVWNRKEEDLFEISQYLKLIRLARQGENAAKEEVVVEEKSVSEQRSANEGGKQESESVLSQSTLKNTVKHSSVEESAKSTNSELQQVKIAKGSSKQDSSQLSKPSIVQNLSKNSQNRQTHRRKRGSREPSSLQLDQIHQKSQSSISSH